MEVRSMMFGQLLQVVHRDDDSEEATDLWHEGIIPRGIKKGPVGNGLLSQGAAPQVPSALAGLTSGFGMGPGVPPPLKSPTRPFGQTSNIKHQIAIALAVALVPDICHLTC